MSMQTTYGGKQAGTYLAQRINSATPEELAAMLLEGAQRFLTQAAAAIRQGDIPARGRLVNRASLIMDELLSMLNAEDGGEVVDKLHGIYIWWIKEMFEGSRSGQPERLERVIRQMAAMRAGWEELGNTRNPAQIQAQAQPAFFMEGLVG
jgi:flagellar protein FliS